MADSEENKLPPPSEEERAVAPAIKPAQGSPAKPLPSDAETAPHAALDSESAEPP
jgi:hypothetical protein